jgi:transposase, IS5 family
MHKVVGQFGFADAMVAAYHRPNETLERIAALIDWRAVAALLGGLRAHPEGRPGYPPLVMLKALLLQQWYGLSDPALEAALADRLSFRRFCGFALAEDTPDHVTLHRFREDLVRHDLARRVFAEITRQIDTHGFLLRQGTLIDASLIEAAVRRPKPPAEPAAETPSSAAAAAPETPPDAAPRPPSKLVRSPHDPEAAWAKKGGRRYFGDKAHVGVDQGSAIIRTALLTPANVNDTVPADTLISGDERAVYGDQAYHAKARTERLTAAGIKDRTMHRAHKHQALTPRQHRRNELIGRRRAPVEQVFARLKRLYGWARVRYRGLARNAVHLLLLCTAMNLRRLVVLAA